MKTTTKTKICDLKREIFSSINPNYTPNEIPTNDLNAWTKFPRYNWVYNKMEIARTQRIPHGPIGSKPKLENFPIVCRPIINLYGMGIGAVKYTNAKKYLQGPLAGMFWETCLEGTHLSIDFLVLRGKPVWSCVFRGYKVPELIGQFDFWESLPCCRPPKSVVEWILNFLPGYTGCLNLECIGTVIIEVHLRMGDLKFIDDDNHTLFKTIIDLYTTNEFTLPKNFRIKKRYLVPVFVNKFLPKKKLERSLLLDICSACKIECLESDPYTAFSRKTMPEDGIRLYLLCCSDLSNGINTRNKILDYLEFAKEQTEINVLGKTLVMDTQTAKFMVKLCFVGVYSLIRIGF